MFVHCNGIISLCGLFPLGPVYPVLSVEEPGAEHPAEHERLLRPPDHRPGRLRGGLPCAHDDERGAVAGGGGQAAARVDRPGLGAAPAGRGAAARGADRPFCSDGRAAGRDRGQCGLR